MNSEKTASNEANAAGCLIMIGIIMVTFLAGVVVGAFLVRFL